MAEELKRVLAELSKRVGTNAGRIRRLELEMEKANRMVSGLKELFMEHAEKLRVGFGSLDDKLSIVAKRLGTIEEELTRLRVEMDKMATKAELSKLEHFVDLFSPLKTKFVTRDELERILSKKSK